VLHARRLVAQRCLYGVDKNPLAVSLARLSLWLVTLAKDEPFTFVDHALRHGDSLVGLDVEQIRSFHWKPGAQMELARDVIDTALHEALDARQGILGLAAKDDTREKERLLWDANDALQDVRLIADLVVGAFFAADKDKAREAERVRRRDLVVNWLESREAPPAELLAMQAALRERVPAFHWWVEFPEVFYGERADPLDGDRANRVAWMDAFVGNPPFMGGGQISGEFGEGYRDWLLQLHEGAHGNADICAHFLRKSYVLLGQHGAFGFITTQSISEGDTRSTGLQPITSDGGRIFDATRSFFWRSADVYSSIVHLSKGEIVLSTESCRLDGVRVECINSRLLAKPERAPASPLNANGGLSFKGVDLGGLGFLLGLEETEELGARHAGEAQFVRKYIGGEDLNTDPAQDSDRYVIDFGLSPLDEVQRQSPALLEIVRSRVKPDRDKNKRESYRDKWWLFAEPRPALRNAIAGVERCVVTARVTKHLGFSIQSTDRVLNEKVVIFPLHGWGGFAVLQSRVHEPWARQLSSSFGASPTLGRVLQYSASDCFETFPFPQSDPRAVIPALEDVGERLYTARAAYMVDTQQGLTQTYNQIKDPRCQEPRVVALRRLHEEMDRAVLAAYGWDDLVVPPYGTPGTDAERMALARFEDEVIDRLFALNAQRAAEEKAASAAAGAAAGGKAKGAKRGKKAGAAGGDGSGQGELGIG
jgi:hypothetical protein